MICPSTGRRTQRYLRLGHPGQSFFDRLFEESLKVISRFPLTIKPAAMEHITGVLEPAVLAERANNPFADPIQATAADSRDDIAIGMNTVGMLLDRLSILAMKHWNLVNRAKTPDKVESMLEPQVRELVQALAQSRPGRSSVNNKMTNRTADVAIDGFASAYYGLLTTNMLLWEAQEILYNHDISMLPCEELRAYINFFSRGNIARNEYIQATDVFYWKTVHDQR